MSHDGCAARRARFAGGIMCLWVTCGALAAFSSVGHAQITTTYEYDSNNRLMEVIRIGPPVEVSIQAAGSVAEGGDLVFGVEAAEGLTGSVEVEVEVFGLNASDGPDFQGGTWIVEFEQGGERSKSVTVATMSDSIYESAETVRARIKSLSGNGTLGATEADGTILNTNPAPSFAINDRVADEGTALVFTVTKTGSTALSHSLNYSTQNGSAVAGSDFAAKQGTLTFGANETSKAVSVSLLTDQVNEGNETFALALAAPSNGAIVADPSGTGTIRNLFYNTPPSAQNDLLVGMEQGTTRVVNVLSNDSDTDGHALTVQSVSAPAFVNVSIRPDNQLSIFGLAAGSGSLTYTVADGHGGTDTALVPLEVTSGGGFVF